jgi:hypothetical protein
MLVDDSASYLDLDAGQVVSVSEDLLSSFWRAGPGSAGSARALFVPARRYPLSSRVSHDFAKSQSRLTVRGEIFRACAVSSSLKPPK